MNFNGLDIQENIQPKDAEALCDLAKTAPEGATIVEVGSWKDMSALILASSAPSARVFCVDTFEGSQETWQEDNKQDIFSIFRHNTKSMGFYHVNIFPLVMPSHVAATIFPQDSIDMIFIDGDHRFTPFQTDLTLWEKRVKPGGIICGHDCNAKFTQFSTFWQTEIHSQCENDWVQFDGSYIHPGITLGLWKAFADDYTIYEGSSIWAKRKAL